MKQASQGGARVNGGSANSTALRPEAGTGAAARGVRRLQDELNPLIREKKGKKKKLTPKKGGKKTYPQKVTRRKHFLDKSQLVVVLLLTVHSQDAFDVGLVSPNVRAV